MIPALNPAYIAGAGNTRFGRLEGDGALELMAQAAQRELDDAGMSPAAVDGVLCGYATTLPHLMLSIFFASVFHCSRLTRTASSSAVPPGARC